MPCARLLLLVALPALAGWCGGDVVSVTAGTPTFVPRQHTAVVAARGHHATLECRVAGLGNRTVSWVRSRDLQILVHAGSVFTADARVVADGGAAGPGAGVSRHTLTISRLRSSDTGRYECQLNTEPKMSLFFNLTVLEEPMPVVEVTACSECEDGAVLGQVGGAVTLPCEARYHPAPRDLPLPPLNVRWRRLGDPTPLTLQGGRGGVSLETERWAARVVSRLTLAALEPGDAGVYSCSAGDQSATLHLLVTQPEERMEMQRDEAGSGAVRGRGQARAAFTTALLVLGARVAL